jgi:hypothetical protein
MTANQLFREDLPSSLTRIYGPCVLIKEEYSCIVPTSGLERWSHGELIHKAMPKVSPEDREFLISGISPTGWKKYFG